MFNYRDLKDQMEQLTGQNQTLSQEIQQLKQLLQDPSSNQNEQQSNSQNQNSNNQNQNSSSQNQKNRNGGISPIINDLLMLKQLTAQLESNMQGYISNHASSQSLTQEDVVNLILHMMNGMIDWTMELESTQNKQSGQPQ